MKLGNDFKNKHRDDRKTSQGFVEIKNMTLEELDELIRRQNKLLLNRCFLQKLSDKGEKILSFIAELKVLQRKKLEESDIACQLLSNLSLKGKNADEIEWKQEELKKCVKQFGSDGGGGNDDDDDNNDDDVISEDENNTLKLIALHSGTAIGKSITSCESEGIINNLNEVKKIFYIDKFCEKYGQSCKFQGRFKPNQLKNNEKALFLTSAEKVKKRLGNKWEITQATPPVPIYNSTVMISLSESLKLQKEQAEKLKEMKKKQATEKLLQNISVKMGDKLPVKNISEYRKVNEFCPESAEDDKENEFSYSDGEN